MYTDSSIKTQLCVWTECSSQIQFQRRWLSCSMQCNQCNFYSHHYLFPKQSRCHHVKLIIQHWALAMMPIWTSSASDYQSSCLPLMLRSKLTMNVRISIGPSSTTSFEGSTGPPRTTLSAGGPWTFHFRRFFSMAARSWFADKLVSMILPIWSDGSERGQEYTWRWR